MKTITVLFLLFFSGLSYSSAPYKTIFFESIVVNIPVNWTVNKKNGCLFVMKQHVNKSDYLKVCKDTSVDESDYFTVNDNGEWEAITDGVPVVADVNTTPKFTGMSAIVSCRYKDDAGYHTDQCFQAELNLPSNISYIFIGRGDASLFEDYEKVYLSLKVK